MCFLYGGKPGISQAVELCSCLLNLQFEVIILNFNETLRKINNSSVWESRFQEIIHLATPRCLRSACSVFTLQSSLLKSLQENFSGLIGHFSKLLFSTCFVCESTLSEPPSVPFVSIQVAIPIFCDVNWVFEWCKQFVLLLFAHHLSNVKGWIHCGSEFVRTPWISPSSESGQWSTFSESS